MHQADCMRYGDQFDELDRATDLVRDEFPRAIHEVVDSLSMEENRLIEKHNRSQNCFSNSYGDGQVLNDSTFAQVTSRSGQGN